MARDFLDVPPTLIAASESFTVVEMAVYRLPLKVASFYRTPTDTLEMFDIALVEMSVHFAVARIVLCGDFNAHSQVWDRRSDSFGNRLLDFASQNHLIVTNDPLNVTFQNSRGMQSVIDVILTCASHFNPNIGAVLRRTATGQSSLTIS